MGILDLRQINSHLARDVDCSDAAVTVCPARPACNVASGIMAEDASVRTFLALRKRITHGVVRKNSQYGIQYLRLQPLHKDSCRKKFNN
jgi:hypothetical protein